MYFRRTSSCVLFPYLFEKIPGNISYSIQKNQTNSKRISMLQTLPFTGRRISKLVVSALFFFFFANDVNSQCGPYGSLRGTRISNINVAGGYYNGLIHWLPSDYNTTTQDYPVIIYFHGAGAVGNGSATDLCEIFTDQPSGGNSTTLPNRIEDGGFGASNVPVVSGTSFIVIAPQYASYNSPFLYSNETEAIINY